MFRARIVVAASLISVVTLGLVVGEAWGSETKLAAKRSGLAVSKVSIGPISATDRTVRIRYTVTNRGRRRVRRSRISFYLSTDRRKSRLDVRLEQRRSVKALRARKRSRASIRLSLPPELEGGAFHVIVCIGRSHGCRASRSRLDLGTSVGQRGAPAPAPAQPSPPPAQPPTSNATELLLTGRGGLWWEPDLDGDLVCYLYDIKVGSIGEHRVVRTSYFVNPFTLECRISEPFTQNSVGAWSLAGSVLTVQYASGFTEQISLGAYDSGSDSLPIARGARASGWAGCRSASYPPTLRTPSCS